MQGMGPQGPQGFGPPGYPGATPTPPGEYEFNEIENGGFRDLASKMRFVGLMSVIFGVLLMVLGLATLLTGGAGGVGSIVQGLFAMFVGIWTRSAAGAFQRIVDTEGNDIGNLMHAVGELRRIYGLQRVLLIIALVFFALGVILFFLFAARVGHL